MATASDHSVVDATSTSALTRRKAATATPAHASHRGRTFEAKIARRRRARERRGGEVPHVGRADADDVEDVRVAVALARDREGIDAAVDLADERPRADRSHVERGHGRGAGDAQRPRPRHGRERLREPEEADRCEPDEDRGPERLRSVARVVLDDGDAVAGRGSGVQRKGGEREHREDRAARRIRRAAASRRRFVGPAGAAGLGARRNGSVRHVTQPEPNVQSGNVSLSRGSADAHSRSATALGGSSFGVWPVSVE